MNNESFPDVEPKDPLVEILPDLYLLRGSIKVAPGFRLVEIWWSSEITESSLSSAQFG